jgi:3-oxoacyl-[acyl-carrier protein] reductase
MESSRGFVITGCASGIGRRLASVLLARGHRVLATDVRADALERVAESENWPKDRMRTHGFDVRSAQNWEQALDAFENAFGRLDVLMNVAGVLRPAYTVDIDPADVDLHFDVNTKGVVYGTRAAAKRMLPRGGGHVVNIGSLAALAPIPGLSLYSASKFAVRAFSLAADRELRERGVAVSVVLPDAVETPMLELQVGYEEAALTFSGTRPLTVDEVVGVITDDVLVHKPEERMIPLSRGLLAKFANLAPSLAPRVEPLLRNKGLAAQQRRRHR